MRVDDQHPEGRLTEQEQLDRMTDALAVVRGQQRATIRTRMDAARWLLNKGWGPPPEGDPAQFDDTDDDGEE